MKHLAAILLVSLLALPAITQDMKQLEMLLQFRQSCSTVFKAFDANRSVTTEINAIKPAVCSAELILTPYRFLQEVLFNMDRFHS